MSKRLIISIALLSVSNLICMEPYFAKTMKGELANNSSVKRQVEEDDSSDVQAKKNKVEISKYSLLYLPKEIIFEIINYLVRGCKDTNEMNRNLYRLASTCKEIKNLIDGKDINLVRAIEVRNFIIHEVQNLMKKEFKPKYKSIGFGKPIIYASQLKDCIKPGLLNCLSGSQKLYLNAFNKNKVTALNYAAQKGDTGLIGLLLAKGIDINSGNNDRPALYNAANYSKIGTVKFLLDNGADTEARNHQGETVLMHCAYYGNSEIAKLLLERGANINAIHSGIWHDRKLEGRTSLMIAADQCKIEMVKLLLDYGADTKIKDKNEKTVLMLANDKANNYWWRTIHQKEHEIKEIIKLLRAAHFKGK